MGRVNPDHIHPVIKHAPDESHITPVVGHGADNLCSLAIHLFFWFHGAANGPS
jgi:hypothetical protein